MEENNSKWNNWQRINFQNIQAAHMAPHSSALAWEIPWTEEPGRHSPWGLWGSDTTEGLHFHFSLSWIGEGNGNPLQCSCLENSRDEGAWWAAIYGVAQSQTRLTWFSSSSSIQLNTRRKKQPNQKVGKLPKQIFLQRRLQMTNKHMKRCSILLIIAPAAAAKLLQSCPTLCDPIDGCPPGSPVPGILQARTLEWVAISFSNAWKWKVKVKSLSRVQLLATPWTAALQAPPSMGFSRQEYWSGVPLPSRIAHY